MSGNDATRQAMNSTHNTTLPTSSCNMTNKP